jgi:hypothetical protein
VESENDGSSKTDSTLHMASASLSPVTFAVDLGIFMKSRRNKKKQSSFTTLHGVMLSLVIAVFVGLIFVLVVLYYHPSE